MLCQVRFPPSMHGSHSVQLKQVIKSCLHTEPKRRRPASQVQKALYEIMLQNGWSNRMYDTE